MKLSKEQAEKLVVAFRVEHPDIIRALEDLRIGDKALFFQMLMEEGMPEMWRSTVGDGSVTIHWDKPSYVTLSANFDRYNEVRTGRERIGGDLVRALANWMIDTSVAVHDWLRDNPWQPSVSASTLGCRTLEL